MRNHTATHLLHRALRNVVGERARQAGSLVTPDYLRFDFPLDRGVTADERRAIEDEVRRIIRDDRPVSIAFMSMAEAIEGGADAFFDEKYGEKVRTIRVQDYSFELCGGTHCRATGQIGGFVITGERSIGSGMRRIEAVTGAAADALVRDRFDRPRSSGRGARRAVDRRRRRADRRAPGRAPRDEAAAQGGRRAPAFPSRASWRRGAVEVAPGVRLVAAAVPYDSMDALKAAARDLSAVLGSGVVALALDADEPQLFVTVSDDLVARGISAGDLVAAAMPALGGTRRWPAGDGPGPRHAARGPAPRRWRPSERGSRPGPDGLLAADLAARFGGGAGRLHRARRRHRVRQGARLRYRPVRARHGPRRRAQAAGPVAHAVGHRRRHRRGRRQLRRRAPGGRGDGRLPARPRSSSASPGSWSRASPRPTARSARSPTSRSPRASSRSSSTSSSARRSTRPSGRSPGRPGCPTSTSGSSTPR